jgi:hypothetical protein
VDAAVQALGRASLRLAEPFDVFVMCPDRDGTTDGVRFVRMDTSTIPSIARLQKKAFKYFIFSRLDVFRSYDVVVMRYVPPIDLAPGALFRRATAKLVTVHHTKEAEELTSGGTSLGLRARAWLESVQSRRVLRRVDGIAAVTDEIREYELARCGLQKPSVTVSNGVDVDRISFTRFVPLPPGAALQIAFVASAHAAWHGTDRLLSSLEAYRGRRRLIVHMVGAAKHESRTLANDRVSLEYHGVLRGEALDAVMRQCTLAISSLAMFRNGLRQGAVLKTREYTARGIPFLYGYEDVDIPNDAPFAMRVDNTNAPIDMEGVVSFAETVSRKPSLSDEMRAFAKRQLDWSVKLRALQRFAHSLV